jgi:hypothetical protein
MQRANAEQALSELNSELKDIEDQKPAVADKLAEYEGMMRDAKALLDSQTGNKRMVQDNLDLLSIKRCGFVSHSCLLLCGAYGMRECVRM